MRRGWSRRDALRALGGVGLVLCVPAVAHADDRKLTLTLSASETRVGKGVYLEVEVSETSSDSGSLPEPTFPDEGLDGLSIVRRGSSFNSSFSMVNGTTTSKTSRTFKYLVMPKAPGTYELDVKVGTTAAKVIPTLKVTGEAIAEPPPPTAGERPKKAPGEVFLWPSVDREEVYVGQALLYRFELWERSNASISMSSLPAFKDFYAEDLPSPRRRSERLGRHSYRVHPLMTRILYPQRSGELAITGGEVLVTPSQRFGLLLKPSNPDPPFTVKGPRRTVKVLPLPAEGQPAGFSPNNVGRYTISAEVDRKALVQGEALKLTVTIEGTGNIHVLDPGDWPELEGFQRYDPKVEVDAGPQGKSFGGTRTYKFLLVSEKAGRLKIPAHALSMFDPEAEAYRTVSTEPITIDVTADPNAAPTEEEDEEDEPAPLGEDEDQELLADLATPEPLPRTTDKEPWLTPSRWLVASLGVPVTLGAAAAGLRLWARFGPDEESRARGARARWRREHLARLRAGVASGEGFHATLAELLQGLAVARAGEDAQGLPRDRLTALLAARGVPERDVATFSALLDDCDAARFGGGAGERTDRQRQLEQALELIERPDWRTS